MNPEVQLLVVMTTVPDQAIGLVLANGLVHEHLAACVQVLPSMTSVYLWEGKICQETEHLLLIKTLPQYYEAVESYIYTHHPYTEPEIIALPATHASITYRHWVASCLSPDSLY
ncbi:MAG: divalent-cation tolerance protein CutA [Pseudanabaenaceae cyanobacterium]